MNERQRNTVMKGELSYDNVAVEEQVMKNFFGNIVGSQIKELRKFRESKLKEREKLAKELKDSTKLKSTLENFDRTTKSIINRREDFVARLKYVYDWLDINFTADNIEVRRAVKKFTDEMDKNILHKGKLPTNLMKAQSEMFSDMYKVLQDINESSIRFSEKMNIDI